MPQQATPKIQAAAAPDSMSDSISSTSKSDREEDVNLAIIMLAKIQARNNHARQDSRGLTSSADLVFVLVIAESRELWKPSLPLQATPKIQAAAAPDSMSDSISSTSKSDREEDVNLAIIMLAKIQEDLRPRLI